MALRIIRKSSSKSHVELINGTEPQRKALLSLLCYVTSQSDISKLTHFLYETEWVNENCELVFMKANTLSEPLRPHLKPSKITSKLINEKENSAPYQNLNDMLEEAGCPICIYLPAELDSVGALKTLYESMQQDNTIGMLGLTHTKNKEVYSMGLTITKEEHYLTLQGHIQEYPKSSSIHLLNGFSTPPLDDIDLPITNQVTACYLPFSALRTKACLEIEWPENTWSDTIVSLHLGLKLREKQYHVKTHTTQINTPLSESSYIQSVLEKSFKNHWPSLLEDDHVEKVYLSMGALKGIDNQYKLPLQNPLDQKIENYLSQLKGQ